MLGEMTALVRSAAETMERLMGEAKAKDARIAYLEESIASLEAERDGHVEEIAELKALLGECRDEYVHAHGYVPEHFKKKWFDGYEDLLARIEAALGEVERE